MPQSGEQAISAAAVQKATGKSWAMESLKSFLETDGPVPYDAWIATRKTAKRG